MKYYYFYKESNDFSDILSDAIVTKSIRTKISWSNWLLLGFTETKKSDNLFGYLVLKYGELIKNPIERNYTPVPGKDYLPVRN